MTLSPILLFIKRHGQLFVFWIEGAKTHNTCVIVLQFAKTTNSYKIVYVCGQENTQMREYLNVKTTLTPLSFENYFFAPNGNKTIYLQIRIYL